MSKATPRRSRHNRHPSNRIPAISDYESDAAQMQPEYDYAPPPPTRTNTELNLAVLQRYLPSIRTILSIAASAVIYTFAPTEQRWDKSGVEGTIHVEVMDELVIMRVEDDGSTRRGEQVLGVWVHNDKTETRDVNAAVIQESWKAARVAGRTEDQGPELGPAMQAIGSEGRLTIDDLFRSQAEARAAHGAS
uniref:Uncharacterized protein n=1 Tax=Bionectria ochroleuca TaxID=29856 RepID=A0A0B7K227_BIOOC